MNEELFFSLMIDLHRDGERQGPGSEEDTLRALALTQLDTLSSLKVADIGCGTGASSLVLAKHLPNSKITAVDLFSDFLDVLSERALNAGVANKIDMIEGSMESLPFEKDTFDLIWSEGAIYNIGFKRGIELWKPILKTNGVLAISEITWLHPNPPAEIRDHWEAEYPEISTAPEKIKLLDAAGYDLIGYLVLPPSSWIKNYYSATESRLSKFAARHLNVEAADEVIAMERREAQLYEQYQKWFSYGFYVAVKR